MRSDDRLIDDLALMCDRQTALRGHLAELSMGEAHNLSDENDYKRPRQCQRSRFFDLEEDAIQETVEAISKSEE